MNKSATSTAHADYGLDAPGVAPLLAILGMAAIAGGVGFYFLLLEIQNAIALILLNWGIWGGVWCLASAGSMIWSSKVGKFRLRDRMIDSIPWRGNEQMLDVGCGRGLLLIAAAKRLKMGRAIGIDIWDPKDQSGNHPDATWANAHVEGVADRVGIRDARAQQLPFPDNTFDVVMSSLVLHNIGMAAERQQAVREMVRVLKPGGRIALLDVLHTGEYARVLRASGMRDVKLSRFMFLFFSPITRIVTAEKSVVE